MFEEKTSCLVSSRSEEDKVLPWDICRAELFFPTRTDILEAQEMATDVAVTAASIFRREFRDKRKATSAYLSAINGRKSINNVSSEEREAGLGIDASNSVSESLHSSSMLGFEYTMRPDHSAAEGQTRHNNDLGRGYKNYITGCPRKSEESEKGREMGWFHRDLVPELQRTAIMTSIENAAAARATFDKHILGQYTKRRNKEEEGLEDTYNVATEDYIVALYFNEQYHNDVCWTSVEVAVYYYNRLGSESRKLEAVKDQILMRYLGLGWKEAYHPWSANNSPFSADELFDHFVDVVLPLADKLDVPTEPPLELPKLPELPTLGTVSKLAEELEQKEVDRLEEIREKARDIKASREEKGSHRQSLRIKTIRSFQSKSSRRAMSWRCVSNILVTMGVVAWVGIVER